MATYVFIFQMILCAQRSLMDAGMIKGEWRYSFWWMGFISAASIFIEKKQRRAELALYVLAPKMACLLAAPSHHVGLRVDAVSVGRVALQGSH